MMRLDLNVSTLQRFFENVAYCRATPSESYNKIVRIAVALFAAVSLYDLATHRLAFPLKVVVHTTLLCLITSFALSLFLKRLLLPPKKEPILENKILPPRAESSPIDISRRRRVKRDLRAEFEQAAKE